MFYINNKKITDAFRSYFDLLWKLFEFIDSAEQYDQLTTNMLNNHTNIKIIVRHLRVPWFLFPSSLKGFWDFRVNVMKRLNMIKSQKNISLKKMDSYQRIFREGHIEFITNKIAIDFYFDTLKKMYGSAFTKNLIKEKLELIRNNNKVKIWIIDSYYSFFTTYLADDEVISVLIHKGLLNGFRSTSKEMIDLHSKQFEEMKQVSKPVEIYLEKLLSKFN